MIRNPSGLKANMVKFDKVTKKFGDVVALCNATFEIEKGEFVFLTGPSGAGKTTIVKLILGEYLPTEGKVFFKGRDLEKIVKKNLTDLRRQVGVIFQDFKLILDRTIFENVALPLEIEGKKKTEIEKEVEEVLKKVGLSQRADFFPAQLAGGELQRASLARALARKPLVLLADEPTGNLDPASSWQLIKLLKKINQEGTTVLMATHNVDIVNSMSTRVIKLDKGKVVKDEKKGKY